MNEPSTHSASAPAPLLFVDDRSANLLALEAVLASAGHEIVIAHSGSDALRLLAQRDFAVVLLDVQMPDMDGFETAAQMKRMVRQGSPVPIIFVTGIDCERSRVLRAYAEGAVDFIQKPLEPQVLRSKVAVFAELYRARQRVVAEQRKAHAEQLHVAQEAARREAAESSLSFAKALIDNLPELAWTARPDGYIDFYNQRWFEFTGTTAEEVAGWGWEKVHDPAILPTVVEQWKHALATGEPFEMEFPLRRADGAFLWFLTRIRPHRNASGKIVRWFGTNTDVDAFRRLRTEAERAVRTREDLLAIVSHDLRNPLSTVLMGAKQIERFADESETGLRTRKIARTILNATDRMARLITDLLDLAKLEAGQPLPLDLMRHDVMDLTRQAADLLAPLVSSRKLTLETDLTEPTYVLCDGDRIQQALSNLIGNAVKFTREGGAIRVGARRTDGEILFSVSDTGAGIPEHQLPRLFTPYWRADSRRKDGAGLGLAIVKAIVDTHGGRLWVESAPGRGSTFHFTIPIPADGTPATEDE